MTRLLSEADAVERGFWPKVNKTDGCWLWTGSRKPAGYGTLTFPGRRTVQAHRVSYALHFGPIPSGLFVLHRCDVRAS